MLTPCTACGCCWDEDGFYHSYGEMVQPCKVCRCDSASIYYLNNAERIRERRRNKYYANAEVSRAYERTRKRQQRAQMSVIS